MDRPLAWRGDDNEVPPIPIMFQNPKHFYRIVPLDDSGIKMDVPDDVMKILGPNEVIELYIKQKIYHPKLNVDSVVITNMRVILRQPHAMGILKDYIDYSYQDIANVVMDKGFLRSTIKFVLRFGGDPLTMEDLPNDEAEKAYGIIRQNLTRFQMGNVQTAQTYIERSVVGPVCPKCGSSVPVGQGFCGKCGNKMK
jgi:hypothetical protein